MALSENSLAMAIASMGTQASASAAAKLWADAVKGYASSITPTSTAVAAACATLQTALTAAFAKRGATPALGAAPDMESAFIAFAVTLAAGMTDFDPVATPPPVPPIGFATIFVTKRDSVTDAGHAVATAIDNWLKTGASTLTVVPKPITKWA